KSSLRFDHHWFAAPRSTKTQRRLLSGKEWSLVTLRTFFFVPAGAVWMREMWKQSDTIAVRPHGCSRSRFRLTTACREMSGQFSPILSASCGDESEISGRQQRGSTE